MIWKVTLYQLKEPERKTRQAKIYSCIGQYWDFGLFWIRRKYRKKMKYKKIGFTGETSWWYIYLCIYESNSLQWECVEIHLFCQKFSVEPKQTKISSFILIYILRVFWVTLCINSSPTYRTFYSWIPNWIYFWAADNIFGFQETSNIPSGRTFDIIMSKNSSRNQCKLVPFQIFNACLAYLSI